MICMFMFCLGILSRVSYYFLNVILIEGMLNTFERCWLMLRCLAIMASFK